MVVDGALSITVPQDLAWDVPWFSRGIWFVPLVQVVKRPTLNHRAKDKISKVPSAIQEALKILQVEIWLALISSLKSAEHTTQKDPSQSQKGRENWSIKKAQSASIRYPSTLTLLWYSIFNLSLILLYQWPFYMPRERDLSPSWWVTNSFPRARPICSRRT